MENLRKRAEATRRDIDGELNRIMVTKEIPEIREMAAEAHRRIELLASLCRMEILQRENSRYKDDPDVFLEELNAHEVEEILLRGSDLEKEAVLFFRKASKMIDQAKRRNQIAKIQRAKERERENK